MTYLTLSGESAPVAIAPGLRTCEQIKESRAPSLRATAKQSRLSRSWRPTGLLRYARNDAYGLCVLTREARRRKRRSTCRLQRRMARETVVWRHPAHRRVDLSAEIRRPRAPRVKSATRRNRGWIGRFADQGNSPARSLASRVGNRNRRQQGDRIGMQRRPEQSFARRHFDDA